MELVLAALPGVITSCLLGFVLFRLLDRQNEERQAHRIEVDALTRAHAEQITELCQRIQAPVAAIGEYAVRNAEPDPDPIDLEDDAALLLREREQQLQDLARQLEGQM